MVKKPVARMSRRTAPPLRWRRTRIKDWRESVRPKMTQQAMADALAEEGIELDRVSVLRIEAGTQMPSIETVEAMARILKTDVDSMLNRTPDEAKAVADFRSLDPKAQRRALRFLEVGDDD